MSKLVDLEVFNVKKLLVFSLLSLYKAQSHLMDGLKIFNSDSDTSITLFIWTRNNFHKPEVLHYPYATSKWFDPNAKTKLLIHGYRDVGDTDWILKTKDEYLAKDNYNVLSLDYRQIAHKEYVFAVLSLRDVGLIGVDFLTSLNCKNNGLSGCLNLKNLHVIGFSLGAHLAGIMGYLWKGRIKRITGLDPARPLFEFLPQSMRLDKTDARNIDVIHAAGYFISIPYAIGTVDFFPNGGYAHQPGCENESFDLNCSHQRANKLFTESIRSEQKFKSFKCKSWEDYLKGICFNNPSNWLGESVNFRKKGSFYLKTGNKYMNPLSVAFQTHDLGY